MKMTNRNWMVGVCALLASACAGLEPQTDDLEPEDRDQGADLDGKFEAWNSANNPAYVDSNFLYYAHQLPVEGHGAVPIPGDYWATVNDNLNFKWDGASSKSPAEKYGAAFGKSDTPEQVSQANGVKSASWRKACTTDGDCADQNDGSSCAASYDGREHRCIPGWWGICHGWSPYALTEPAARNPVSHGGVTFYPGDLEGLMSLLYTDVQTKFLSARCDKMNPPTDSLGRVIDGSCRDMNPGSWHILVTNMMGLRHQGFVLDQTYDDQVWNQPAYGYRITNLDGGALKAITKADAITILGLGQSLTSLLDTTTLTANQQKSGQYTAQAAGTYTVKLTGTGDADLYVKKGSAPTADSYDCRPYTATAVEQCQVTLAAGESVYWMVNGYAASSSIQVGIAVPSTNGTYSYNTAAVKFYYVEMDFTFIVEARPGRSSHVDQALASYADTKHYSYVLEADANDKIVGGEWANGSQTDHPDFAWWPTGKPSTVAGISYADIKALNDQSAGAQPANDVVTAIDNYRFTSSAWASKYASVTVEPGYRKLAIEMTGTGDADLYVRAGSQPTIYVYTCKSATAGTSAESCTVDVPAAGQTFIVRARSKTPGTTVTVTAHKLRS